MIHKPAKWNEYLRSYDTDKIWKELHRICGQHRLSRYSTKFDQLVDEGKFNKFTDLTQELFVTLLEKDRFKYYIDTEMTDAEIEMEISQIELTNILTVELRKRYPESYRISRRILQLLQNSNKFSRLNTVSRQRISEHLYGLNGWSISNCKFDTPAIISSAMATIPHIPRNLRRAGCAGDSQIIISNNDLEVLMVSIFKAVNQPLSVKEIRSLTMSKLTILDINLTPIESFIDDEEKPTFELRDDKNLPLDSMLKAHSESYEVGKERVDAFLSMMFKEVKYKNKQYQLVLGIIRYCYIENLSQWDASKQLSVSDSLISGYRKIIDNKLRELRITTMAEAQIFHLMLREKIIKLSENKIEE